MITLTNVEPQTLYLILAITFGFLMACGIGANDVANAMGTSVGSRAISIKQAIIIAAIFEFLGAFLAGGEVTHTIKQNIIDINLLNDTPEILILGMLSSLMAAGFWLFIASFFGWPISTTHTIVGAIIGFGGITLGLEAIKWSSVISIILGWLASPLIGAVLAYLLFITAQQLIFNQPDPIKSAKKIIPYYIFLCSWIIFMITFGKLEHFGIKISTSQLIWYPILSSIIVTLSGKWRISKLKFNPNEDIKFHYTNLEKIFAILMIFTACAMAFAHGSNDVANAIGPVAAIIGIIDTSQSYSSTIPFWLMLMGAVGIVIGLSLYGHKVIATVGSQITQLTPSRGFSATLSAASTVIIASSTGLPISTTHTLVGAILGIGLARGVDALNLNVIRTIFISWFITLPAGTLLSIIFFKILQQILA